MTGIGLHIIKKEMETVMPFKQCLHLLINTQTHVLDEKNNTHVYLDESHENMSACIFYIFYIILYVFLGSTFLQF